MKIKFIMAIVAVAVMTGGCSSSDEVQQDGRVPIRLSATVESSKVSHTRAGTTGSTTQDTELLDGQTVAAYIKEKDGDWIANPLACTVSGTDGDLTYSGNYNYPMDGTPVTIYAVHPSSATSGNAFTVSANQTDADIYAASDLCYSKTADYNRQEAKQLLTFSHVLSKIIVNVDVSGLGITPAPAVTNLMLWAKTQTTMTYPTGSNPDYSLSDASTPGYIAMNVGGAAIIPPQTTTAAGDVRITFDVAGIGPIAYDFPASTEFASNTEYTYTVKVGTTITVTSSINPWGGSDTPENTYTGYATPTEPKYMKNPLWYVAEYNMTNPASSTLLTMGSSDDEGYYYTWTDALNLFSTGNANGESDYYNGYKYVSGTPEGTTWHLPVKGELLSIMPGLNPNSLWGLSGYQSAGVTTIFGYNDATKAGISDVSYWVKAGDTEMHAIRYIGTPYCSAWKYVISSTELSISSVLIQTVISDDTEAAVWYSNNFAGITWENNDATGSAQRVFRIRGNRSDSGSTSNGSFKYGYYMSSTVEGGSPTKAWLLAFHYISTSDLHADVAAHTMSPSGRNVRLFRDN